MQERIEQVMTKADPHFLKTHSPIQNAIALMDELRFVSTLNSLELRQVEAYIYSHLRELFDE